MPDNRKKIGKTKQILAAIFRIPLESDASDAIAKVILSQTQAGQTVDKETVLKLSAVWACTRLISETISTLPLKVYERDGELRRAAYNVPQYRLLHDSPNAYSTSQTWLQANVASMLFHGNAWNHIRRTGSLITSIEFINPNALVGVNRDSNRNIVSIVYRNNNEDITVRMADLLHIPAFTTDGKTGLSAIQHGASVFGSALAASDSANNHFKNGLMPTTAFLYDKPDR
jgi:HK97 family phage portal protein